MALSHLLRAKQRLHLRSIGYAKSTRWFSSTVSEGENDKSSPCKKGGGTREQKEKAVESYVNKYMGKNPGVFPKPTHVHKEIGGSWYTLKDILQTLKEKIMSNHQLQAPNTTVDSKATNSPDKTEVGGDKITVSPIVMDTAFENMMNLPASKAKRENGYFDHIEFDKSKNVVQSSPSMVDSFVESKIIGKNFLEEIGQENNSSDSSKLLEFKTGERGPEEPKGIQVNLDSDLISKFDRLSCKKSQDSFVNRLRSIGYGNQAESEMTCSSRKTNVGPDMGSRPSLFGGTDKSWGLADLFMKRMNNGQPAVKLENFTKSQNTLTLQDFGETKLTSSEYENNQSASSSGAQKIIVGLADSVKNNQEEVQVIETTNEMLTPVRSTEYSKEARGEIEAKSSELRGLINCIKVLPRDQSLVRPEGKIVSNKTNRSTLRDPLTGFESPAEIEKEEGGHSIFNAFDRLNSTRVPLQMIHKELTNTRGANQNKVLVRFLPKTANESDVFEAFRCCGDIERIELLHGKQSSIKFAFICFKTVEGMKKALQRSDTFVRSAEVTVEEAASTTMDSSSNTLPVPNLIGDPDASSALIKNPTQTVVIKPLTRDICLHQIEEALAVCESKISSVLLGSSRSVAYVEFKTEEGKERALEKHFIYVLGKQLSITRIDVPRTTVVRISNLHSLVMVQNLNRICESCGKIRSVKHRLKGIVDVHFELEEWPNMLNILNRLNGMEVEGERLVATPAPVFPPEILLALWSRPDERRHVKSVLRGLLLKFGESLVNKVALADIAGKLYGD